jgi:hypothetical protein
MSDVELTKAATIRAPNDYNRTANDFGGLLFTCDNTIAVNALPQEWSKRRWVFVRNRGSVEAHYAFSTHDDAVIDPAATATAEGTSDEVGFPIAAGELQQVELPKWESTSDRESLYFVRITASGSADLLVFLGDGE